MLYYNYVFDDYRYYYTYYITLSGQVKSLRGGTMNNQGEPGGPGEVFGQGERLVDARTIARLTGIPLQTIWRACREGTLPHFRLARTVRFDPVEVLNHLRRDAVGSEHSVPFFEQDNGDGPDPDQRVNDIEWWSQS